MSSVSVFVGGLSDDIQKEDLEREFSRFGTLSKVWVARNPPGFAFIEFEDEGDANEAIKEMNGASINGTEIRVDRSRNNGRGRGGRGGRRGGGFRGGRGGGGGGGYSSSGYGSYGGRGGSRYGGGGDYSRSSYGSGDDYRSSGSGYRSRSPINYRNEGGW